MAKLKWEREGGMDGGGERGGNSAGVTKKSFPVFVWI